MKHEIILCGKCEGYGRLFIRHEPTAWRKLGDGLPLGEFSEVLHPCSKLVDCDECDATGRLRIPVTA